MVVIEHNLDVIKTADWIIDLGPEGGARGGEIIATGTPEEVAAVKSSYTGTFLKGDPGETGPASPPLAQWSQRRSAERVIQLSLSWSH